MSGTWIILGATSSMARAFARKAATAGDAVLLAGRDLDDLRVLADDCRLRGAPVAEPVAFDARRPETFAALAARAARADGPVNAAVFVGSMPAQGEIDADPALIDGVVCDSFTGPARVLHVLAPLIEAQRGTVIGVGSVAGDRGRIGNYVYGAAKGMVALFLQGLRNRLARKGVQVLTIKPGFVDTPMTAAFSKGALWAQPADVARGIVAAIDKGRDEVYLPGFWRLIMLVIRHIPEFVFKKLSL